MQTWIFVPRIGLESISIVPCTDRTRSLMFFLTEA